MPPCLKYTGAWGPLPIPAYPLSAGQPTDSSSSVDGWPVMFQHRIRLLLKRLAWSDITAGSKFLTCQGSMICILLTWILQAWARALPVMRNKIFFIFFQRNPITFYFLQGSLRAMKGTSPLTCCTVAGCNAILKRIVSLLCGNCARITGCASFL